MFFSCLDDQLLDAVINNDASLVHELLLKGANPNCYEDSCKVRPLHFAALYDSCNTVFYLLQNGAYAYAKTSEGYTALELAQEINHKKFVKLMLKYTTNLIYPVIFQKCI